MTNRIPRYDSDGDDNIDGTAGGGLVLIETQTPSGVSSVDFTTGIGSTFDHYEIRISDLVPASDNVDLYYRVSTDGGSNYKSGASDYEWSAREFTTDGNFGSANNDSDTKIRLNQRGIGSAAGEGIMGSILISNPANSNLRQIVRADLTSINQFGKSAPTFSGGSYLTAESINAVQLLFSSGNVESGTVTLCGVVS